MWKLVAIVLAALSLFACNAGPRPSREQIAAVDVGPAPSQAAAEWIANVYLRQSLKDPMSAQVEFGPVRREAYALAMSTEWKYAWLLPVMVNAKNSFGGYTGATTWGFFFRGGKWIAVQEPAPMGNSQMIREFEQPEPFKDPPPSVDVAVGKSASK